ncbi:unnamed protein product [Heligmosomoides polygyrus]|uniref:ANAPC4_WD40 domain-containing protein n=1 Tax=Heligmosomoides polygyrus TaxID=6339 RepID=A0A183FGB9_HELPZ|nr:unnamed protein product [Heligmosomoides polygyrus]
MALIVGLFDENEKHLTDPIKPGCPITTALLRRRLWDVEWSEVGSVAVQGSNEMAVLCVDDTSIRLFTDHIDKHDR